MVRENVVVSSAVASTSPGNAGNPEFRAGDLVSANMASLAPGGRG